jgi:hypothetical protein
MIKATKEKVYLKKIDKEVILDFFTLSDDQWVIDTFGEERTEKAFMEFDPEVILSMFWNQLSNDSKKVISQIKIFKWEGLKEVIIDFTDPVEKLKNIVSGADELMAIWAGIISTKRKSIPSVDENLKKKVTGESL